MRLFGRSEKADARINELSEKMKRLRGEADLKLDQAAAENSKKKRRMLKREAEKLFDQADRAENAWSFLVIHS
ncbi:MAG TPA: hypothetical protein VMT89_09380 [Candidatus Acidoferrales bacterium]|nr:hypothetical protein [Candidatus Acidoferrales bacterium]